MRFAEHDVHDDSPTLRLEGVFALVFASILALTVSELWSDLRHGTSAPDVLVDLGLASAGLCGLVWVSRRVLRAEREAARLRRQAHEHDRALLRSREDPSKWPRDSGELLASISAAVNQQLMAWQLNEAERDVALLLLRGFSHQQVAELRGIDEPVVRQHARAVFRKARVTDRHELAAFFLEDLLGAREVTVHGDRP